MGKTYTKKAKKVEPRKPEAKQKPRVRTRAKKPKEPKLKPPGPDIVRMLEGQRSEVQTKKENNAQAEHSQDTKRLWFREQVFKALAALKESKSVDNFAYDVKSPEWTKNNTGLDFWAVHVKWGSPASKQIEIVVQRSVVSMGEFRWVVNERGGSKERWADTVDDFYKLLVWAIEPMPEHKIERY